MYLSFGQSWKLRNPKSKANQKLKTNLDSWKLGLEILIAHAHYKIQSDFLQLSLRMSHLTGSMLMMSAFQTELS